MTFHQIIGNGGLRQASIFFNINQTTLANCISNKDFQFNWYPIIKDWKYVDFWTCMNKLAIHNLKDTIGKILVSKIAQRMEKYQGDLDLDVSKISYLNVNVEIILYL